MVEMLANMYGQQYRPQAMAKNRAQADTVAQKSGTDHDRYFLNTTIAHHREGIAMIDRYLPTFTDDHVRGMAEEMKTAQEREIDELEGKLEG